LSPRRKFVLALGGASLATAFPSLAQQPPAKPARIGILGATSAAGYASRWDAMRAGLRDLGYVEGRNLVIESRWADGQLDRLPELAAELVRLRVDVIVTHGIPGTRAARQATETIPIVMAIVTDPAAAGLVASLARPGGNVTGSSFFAPELAAKRLDLVREFRPGVSQVAVLVNPDNPAFTRTMLDAMETTATSLNVRLRRYEARRPADFEGAFAAMAKDRVEAATVLEEAMLNAHPAAIAALAGKHRLPSIGNRELAEAGGLIGYGVDLPALFRRAAYLVDRILKGAKAGDLPIEQATTFALAVNLRTAGAIGVAIPQAMLLRADQVIR
jgi:putative ABC transport system substrate-binding protein